MRFTTRCAVAILLFVLSFASLEAKSTKHIKKGKAVAEIILPRTKMDVDGHLIPDVHAAAAVVLNSETDEVIFQQRADEMRSIASITKVMTAQVIFEQSPDLNRIVTVEHSDVSHASHTFLRARDKVSVDALLHLMLIASDNGAARALARTSDEGTTAFIERMNTKAFEMGLSQTHYTDPSGLMSTNVSTALDMAHLLIATADDMRIANIMQQPQYVLHTGKRTIVAPSTDRLLGKLDIVAAKTGYIGQSGFCVVMVVRQDSGQTIAIVVLGAKSNAERFIEVENLYKWLALMDTVPAGPEACGPYPESVSPQGMDFIKWHEGFHARAYRDSGGWAIGYGMHSWKGHRVNAVYPKRVTISQADAEFIQQLAVYQDIVEANVCAPLQQSAYDALVSIAWNLGRVNTNIIDKYAHPDGILTVKDFISTATVHRRPDWLLTARRIREFLLFGGNYEAAMNTHVHNRHDVAALYQEVRFLKIHLY